MGGSAGHLALTNLATLKLFSPPSGLRKEVEAWPLEGIQASGPCPATVGWLCTC